MHELWAFVEIGRVVFVAFDNEVVAGGHAKADAKILRDSANQESRVQGPLVHYPGSDARGCSFAMRARNHKGAPAANELFFNNLGLRAIKQFSIERCFNFGV